MRNRLLSGLMMLLFIYINIGHYVIYKMKQNVIKAEMSHQIHQNTFNSEIVELIRLDQKDKELIHWMDENEFMYHGRMYDLISQEFVGNQIQIYALEDTKEASLESEFESFILSLLDQKESNDNTTISIKIFDKDYFYDELQSIVTFFELVKFDFNTNYHFSDLSVHTEIATPPPRYRFHLI